MQHTTQKGESMAKGEDKAKPTQPPMDVRDVPLALIDIGPQMIRHDQDDDDVIELAGDIATHGMLQPIGVAAGAGERYQLLWGSRRLAAYTRLRRPTIPARVCEHAATETIIGTALRENLLRRQLTLSEEIDAIHNLVSEGLAAAQISNLLGKSRSWVDRRLAFRSLPPEIGALVLAGDLPLGHGEALALLTDPSAQSYLLAWAVRERPSLTTLRSSIEALQNAPTFGAAVEAGATEAQHPSTAQRLHLECHVCRHPTPIDQLVIIRTCTPCTAGMAGAGAPKEDDHATQ